MYTYTYVHNYLYICIYIIIENRSLHSPMNWSVLKLQFLRVTSPLMQNVVDKIRWISLNLSRSNSIPLYSHYIITLHFISKPCWVLCNRNQSIHRFLMVRLNDTLNLIETTALYSYELPTKMLTIHKNPLNYILL